MSDRIPGSSTSNPILYKDYEISVGPGYTPDSRWQYAHEDYDGPEDNRCGLGSSIDDCKEQIDEIELDQAA